MKTRLFLFYLLLFFSQHLSGQMEPRLYQQLISNKSSGQNNFSQSKEITYLYRPSGELDVVTSKNYFENGELNNTTAIFYSYNTDELPIKVTQRKYNPDVDLWITIYWYEYEYDSNGCLSNHKKIENLGGLFFEYEYERNSNCQIIKETYWQKPFLQNDLQLKYIHERDYKADGISYVETQYISQVFLNNNLVIKSIWDNDIHPNGKLDKVYTIFNDNNGDYKYEGKYFYEYDIFENITSNTFYRKDTTILEWKFLYQTIYSIEYDNLGRLIEVKNEYTDSTFTPPFITNGFSYNYEYTCDNLEKIKIQSSGDGSFLTRTESFYDGEDQCFDIENEILEIEIFPNPSNGQIKINSQIFKSGNTTISVFDISGKLVLQKNEPRRRKLIEFNLGHLPKGMYIIQLMNQDHFVKKKVVIVK